MGIENRKYTRIYFRTGKLAALTLLVGRGFAYTVEIMNISVGGICLSMDNSVSPEPEHTDELNLKSLPLDQERVINNCSLKLCYSYRAQNLGRIVCGLEFLHMDPENRRQLEAYIQHYAETEEKSSITL